MQDSGCMYSIHTSERNINDITLQRTHWQYMYGLIHVIVLFKHMFSTQTVMIFHTFITHVPYVNSLQFND